MTKSRSEARSRALRLHEDVRDALRELVRDARDGGRSMKRVEVALRRLGRALDRHATEERRWLVPVLRDLDAWGDVRVSHLQDAHERELAILEAARADSVARVVHRAPSIARSLHAALLEEEERCLSPELLRDDIVCTDQEDG
jgi:hypothetical protein